MLPRQTIQHHSIINPSLCPTTNTEEVEWLFYEELQDLVELTHTHTHTHKDVLFIIGDWNAKVGSQEIPAVIGKFGLGVQDEAGQRLTFSLPREYTGHSKHPLSTTQETALHMDTIRWQIPKSD